ncbi:hypothetical protein ACVD6H_001983 [Klebsiella pneumoniae]
MTDITELAQREKFEAWAEECNALPWGYLKKLRIYTGFYSDHTYTSLWAAWKAAGAELVEALEKAQQVDEELCRLLPPGVEYMDPPDGGDVTPLEGVRRMVADYRQRIAELESRTVTVKLPQRLQPGADGWDDWYMHSDNEGEYLKFDDVLAMLTAAGIKVEAE